MKAEKTESKTDALVRAAKWAERQRCMNACRRVYYVHCEVAVANPLDTDGLTARAKSLGAMECESAILALGDEDGGGDE